MPTASIKSGVYPTEEMATASLDGSFIELEKGQKIKVLNITTVEVEGGWVAIAFVDISDLEADETEDNEKAEAKPPVDVETDDAGVPDDNAFHIDSVEERGSIAKDSIPEMQEPDRDVLTAQADIIESDDDDGTAGNGDSIVYSESVASEDAMVSEEEREEAAQLSEELRTDFIEAQNDDVPPFPLMGETDRLEEEEEELRRQRQRHLTEDAILAAEAEFPAPAPAD